MRWRWFLIDQRHRFQLWENEFFSRERRKAKDPVFHGMTWEVWQRGRRQSSDEIPTARCQLACWRRPLHAFFPPLGTIYFALRCDGSSRESIDPSRALASFKAEHLIGDVAKSLLAGRRVFHRWKRSTMFAVFLKWCATLISWTGIYARFMPVDRVNQF